MIVEICIADAIASNVFVDQIQYADIEIDKSASLIPLYSWRSADLIVEICIADAIASNVFVDRIQYADTEIDKSASLIR